MKKILNGPTVWRAKCPGCNRYLHHEDSTKSTTETKREDTMTT